MWERQNIYLAGHCLAVLPLGGSIICVRPYHALTKAQPGSSHTKHPPSQPAHQQWGCSLHVPTAPQRRECPAEGTSVKPCWLIDRQVLCDSEAVTPEGRANLTAIQLLSWLISECLVFGLLLFPLGAKPFTFVLSLLLILFSLGSGLALLFAACDLFLVCRSAVFFPPTLLAFRRKMLCLWPALGPGCPCLFSRMRPFTKDKPVS